MATAKPKSPAEFAAREPEAPSRLPLVSMLRLDLSALDVDANTPDFAERFFQMASDNEPYNFEYTATGELIVMPPSGWESGANEQAASSRVALWQDENGGLSFPPTVMFNLPNGARYMPDASWITQERYEALLSHEYQGVIDGAPDFVIEICSRNDSLSDGLVKMGEWMAGGARLGWYLDLYGVRAYVFRLDWPVEVLDDPETLSGEDVLPGFVFEVRRLIFARHRQLPSDGE